MFRRQATDTLLALSLRFHAMSRLLGAACTCTLSRRARTVSLFAPTVASRFIRSRNGHCGSLRARVAGTVAWLARARRGFPGAIASRLVRARDLLYAGIGTRCTCTFSGLTGTLAGIGTALTCSLLISASSSGRRTLLLLDVSQTAGFVVNIRHLARRLCVEIDNLPAGWRAGCFLVVGGQAAQEGIGFGHDGI